jgi:DNA-binding winged helix-turn-helix (wHTH) protein
MKSIFQAGGPLPDNSPVYVERAADQEMLRRLLAMRYIKLISPRQTGKTSLILRLQAQLANRNCVIAYVDAEDLNWHDEATWYQDLCSRLAKQLQEMVEKELPTPCHFSGFRQFLTDLAEQVTHRSRRLAIALDECGDVPQEWSEGFFKVLREVFTVRQIETYFNNLTFILAGAFDPRDFIKDERISPFNVAEDVDLEDFDLSQVYQLVKCLGVSDEVATVLANSIYSWTSGQPYLTQKMCSLLEEKGTPYTNEHVEQGANWICTRDDNHLPFIFRQLKVNPEERDYLKTLMLQRAKIRFNPSVDRRHRKLTLIGVIKGDEHGNCIVRNRIYKESFFSPPPGIFVDEQSGDVWLEGKLVNPPLTHDEFKLLAYLYERCNEICTRDDIAIAVWSGVDGVSDAAIDQMVTRVRKRIEPDPTQPRYILTVRGRGFRLVNCSTSETSRAGTRKSVR